MSATNKIVKGKVNLTTYNFNGDSVVQVDAWICGNLALHRRIIRGTPVKERQYQISHIPTGRLIHPAWMFVDKVESGKKALLKLQNYASAWSIQAEAEIVAYAKQNPAFPRFIKETMNTAYVAPSLL
jgi:3-mercaptopyruvate sulfurtransferase SseA